MNINIKNPSGCSSVQKYGILDAKTLQVYRSMASDDFRMLTHSTLQLWSEKILTTKIRKDSMFEAVRLWQQMPIKDVSSGELILK